jgi:hypothetical protein
MNTLAERVGGVLVAPRRALALAAEAPAGRGLADVTWLIAAKLVASEAPRLVRAGAKLVGLGVGDGLRAFVDAAAQVLPDAVGVLVASMVMSLLVPASATPATPEPSTKLRAGAIDLAAYAWVPYLAVELAAALAFTALRRAPTRIEHGAITAVALAWALAVWVVGLLALRARRPEAS